ncbi:MAG: transcriptional regulator FtrA [Gammaproteobacteria bacterium]|nr:transcriptional regulator FtrA [Gammaproteobacteria bacterium]
MHAARATTGPRVVALAYDGLCTFELAVAVEIFGLPRPEMGTDWYRFDVAAIEPGPLRATGGIGVIVDGGLELLELADVVIAPGWRGLDAPVPERLCAALRAAHARGARLLSICSGVAILAATGLLDGRRATTHWRYLDELARRHPHIQVVDDVLYVDEGQLLTSAGSAAGIDLCLHLVRRERGVDAANQVARRLVVAPHRDGNQLQQVSRPVSSAYEGPRLGALLDWMQANLHRPITIAELAERAGMSTRTFARRFVALTGSAPAEWLLRARVRQAEDLLRDTRLPLEQVAQRCGFTSAASLRHHFRLRLAVSPSAYRRRVAPAASTEDQRSTRC